jgi:hypothetical protein
MIRYIMKVNSENMEEMIFLKSFSENLEGVNRKAKASMKIGNFMLLMENCKNIEKFAKHSLLKESAIFEHLSECHWTCGEARPAVL